MHVDKGGRGNIKGDVAIDHRSNYKLWAEVLKLALLDMHENDSSLKKAAFKFIKSDEPGFPSFVSICKVLDIDHIKVRDQVLSGQVTKKSFQITIVRCCECGKLQPIDIMKKLEDFGMYVCKGCQRALRRESN